MTKRTLVGFGIAVVSVIGRSVASLEAAASIKLVPVLTGLNAPLFATDARDGSHRLFVVEQGGVIKVLQPGNTAPTVFLDITSRVLSGGERGLLGLTFHPQFSSNRRFFVDYTRPPDSATVIAEYRVSPGNPNIADSTETVLLVMPQPFANHNGGMVEFGPDGFLYIGMGDGGSANDPGNRAQDITQLLGKILRIDVDDPNGEQPYSSPPSNPFYGSIPGADEIYAYGLRNPWRFSFDRSTGDLYAGDVGQGAVEEIDIITLGGNYGWRIWGGTHCTGNDPGFCNPAGFIFPIAEYGHTAGRCSVTGGYAYRGALSSLPVGSYLYGDFCTGEIFVLQNGTSSVALVSGLNISSFGEDESGELYVVGLGGTVHRIANAGALRDTILAAVLPLSRFHTLGSSTFPTAFAAIINAGSAVAANCRVAGPTSPPAGLAVFNYQTVNASLVPIGTPNTPANIAPGAFQGFVFGFAPTGAIPAGTSLAMRFLCDNAADAAQVVGVNNLFIGASAAPSSDPVALLATISGDAVMRIPGSSGAQLAAAGVSNVGATAVVTVAADTGGVPLPVTLLVCETNGVGACLTGFTPSVTVAHVSGTGRTYAIAAFASGPISFQPGVNRVYLRITEGGVGGPLHGATAAAICTTPNPGC